MAQINGNGDTMNTRYYIDRPGIAYADGFDSYGDAVTVAYNTATAAGQTVTVWATSGSYNDGTLTKSQVARVHADGRIVHRHDDDPPRCEWQPDQISATDPTQDTQPLFNPIVDTNGHALQAGNVVTYCGCLRIIDSISGPDHLALLRNPNHTTPSAPDGVRHTVAAHSTTYLRDSYR